MGISETDLPGIGRRYELDVRDRKRAVAVVHNDGRRDLFAFEPGDTDASASVQLDDRNARELGAILSGAYYRPLEVGPVSRAIRSIATACEQIPEGSPLAGRSIMELELRQRTGVTIVAVLAGSSTLIDPAPGVLLQTGDRIVVVGTDDALERLRELLRSEEAAS